MISSATGYMCMIDFDDELGRAKGGTPVYSSVEDLKENHDCWESCGIVKVRVEYLSTIVEQNLNWERLDDGV